MSTYICSFLVFSFSGSSEGNHSGGSSSSGNSGSSGSSSSSGEWPSGYKAKDDIWTLASNRKRFSNSQPPRVSCVIGLMKPSGRFRAKTLVLFYFMREGGGGSPHWYVFRIDFCCDLFVTSIVAGRLVPNDVASDRLFYLVEQESHLLAYYYQVFRCGHLLNLLEVR